MHYAYFPGCAAHSTARDQDLSTRELFAALKIELVDLKDWNCCGATPGHTVGGDLGKVLSIRNLSIAADTGGDLLVPCASCFGNLKSAALTLASGELPEVSSDFDISLPKTPVEVHSVVSALSRQEVTRLIATRRSVALRGLKVAVYYGCLLVRPQTQTGVGDCENPREMETVIKACGAGVVEWPHKTDCCGGPNTVSHPESVSALSGKLVSKAKQFGADTIVTACPMCHASLETAQWEQRRTAQRGDNTPLPIFYLSELAAIALGVPRQDRWLKRHLIDPRPLLKSIGALR